MHACGGGQTEVWTFKRKQTSESLQSKTYARTVELNTSKRVRILLQSLWTGNSEQRNIHTVKWVYAV